jgi:membrane-bound lytic murein transglycosylase D
MSTIKHTQMHFVQRLAKQQCLTSILPSLLVFSLLGSLTGCLSLPEQRVAKDEKITPMTLREAPNNKTDNTVAEHTSLAVTSANTAIGVESLWDRLRSRFRLGHINHPLIDKEIKHLQDSPVSFRRVIARATPYIHFIVEQIEKENLPGELALLPAIESAYQPHAHSPHGAAGLWQFMPATGRMLGLKQDWWYDGRRDVVLSTKAALTYLIQHHKHLQGDWLHALAAYNAGGSAVRRALRKAKKNGTLTGFWQLDLPNETDLYIPRLLAYAAVIAEPGHYGLSLPQIANKPYFAIAPTNGQIDLNKAAELADIDLDTLMKLNPGLNRWATPPQGPHRLLLPHNKVDAFNHALAQLPENKRLRWQRYTIKPGDSLSVIAQQYNISISAIRQTNNLKSNRIRAGKTLLIPLSHQAATPAS